MKSQQTNIHQLEAITTIPSTTAQSINHIDGPSLQQRSSVFTVITV